MQLRHREERVKKFFHVWPPKKTFLSADHWILTAVREEYLANRISGLPRGSEVRSMPGKHAVRKVAGPTQVLAIGYSRIIFHLVYGRRILDLACIVISVRTRLRGVRFRERPR